MDWALQTDNLVPFLSQSNLKDIAATIRERFSMQRPATLIGPQSLVSLHVQDIKDSAAYDKAAENLVAGEHDASLLPPHPKMIASHAFHSMLAMKQDQSIVLIGESGSGKSQNRLAVSKQLVDIARNGKKKSKILSGATKMEIALESFGTFTTTRSQNASGYGRYTEYQYSQTGRMVGVKILDYGFNKSAVVKGAFMPDGHRPYHVFYQLLAGASPEERSDWSISDSDSFVYTKGVNPYSEGAGGLGRSSTLTRKLTLTRSKSVSKKQGTTPATSDSSPLDAVKFQTLRDNLKSLGIGKRTQSQVFKILAAILHLGNLVFADDEQKTQEPCIIKNDQVLNTAASLLAVSNESLKNAILYRSKTVGKDTFSNMLKAEGASKQRDDLASTLYSLVFTWLIEHINERLCKDEKEVDQTIGVLHFPWLQLNQSSMSEFDTLFSNYAFERVVHFTNSFNFEEPLAILKSQNIPLDTVDFNDNQFIVDLFDGTPRLPGLWSLLDKSSTLEVPAESSQAKEVCTTLDVTLKPNPHFVASTVCVNGQTTMSGPAQSCFGIKHYTLSSGALEYSVESFLDQDTVLGDFVALFGGDSVKDAAVATTASATPEKTFLATLFSKKNGLHAVKTDKGRVSGTKKTQEPLRKPSMKGKPKPQETSSELIQFSSATASLNSLFDSLKKTRHWTIFCIRPTDRKDTKYNELVVTQQIQTLHLNELAKFQSTLDIDVTAGITYEEFIQKYGSLVSTVGGSKAGSSASEQVKQFITNRLWPSNEIAFGSTILFLSQERWRWIHNAMKRVDGAGSPNVPAEYELPNNDWDGGAPFSPDEDSFSEYSESPSQLESEFQFADKRRSKMDIEMGPLGASKKAEEASKNEIVEKSEKVTTTRKVWVCFTWLLTWWIPSFCLYLCGMKRPDIRMAWREKVALCIIIFLMCSGILFMIIGLRYVICPPVAVLTPSEVDLASKPLVGARKAYFSAFGTYVDATELMSSHLKSYGPGTGPAAFQDYSFTALYGTDVSRLFYKADNWDYYCPNLPTPSPGWDNLDSTLDWQDRYDNSILPRIRNVHRTIFSPHPLFIESLWQYAKGKVGWSMQTIQAISSATKTYIVLYGNVYYVNQMRSSGSFSAVTTDLFSSQNSGRDITDKWKAALANASPQVRSRMESELRCINQMFYIGTVDNRNTLQCSLSSGLLFGASIVLVCVIGVKFLAALQFGTKKEPEQNDKFVILMVPCYTEGTDSLTKTINSLSAFDYDDKRKLLFVICDGMIIGSGNDRPTPRIVLDILGVDSTQDPEPQAFHSLGEGNKQYNMGKVYSGLYQVAGRSIPFIVVVKCGSRTERVKPGNRGKRDSQLILMRFLNRVHFNTEFSPMELELYHQMKNVIGVSPSYYEYILMVDADTEAEPNALNRMLSVMIQDSKIIGLCGETKISNEKKSWVTMIQVYEYFISHHMAKAFESLFGTVTCLPGCFSMYRIRTGAKNIPVIVSPGLIADYSENCVDTLHTKNLLHLGEDRYLTTLLLKHFPNMKTRFTGEARCHTVVPDQWSVLLSQRRRWINSTVHNLLELVLLDQLCGFCCFSMRFVVLIDLFATVVQPATILYIAYLIFAVSTSLETFPLLSLILIVAIYGFQVIIFIIKREWSHIMWMFIYILATPIISFWIPVYSFWHFDDFSWGNTRVVVGDGKKTVYVADTEPFDPKSIPLKKWKEFEETELWENDSVVSGSTAQSYNKVAKSEFSVASYDSTSAKKQKYASMVSFGGGEARNSVKQQVQPEPLPPHITDELLFSEIQQALQGADLMTLTKKQIRDNLSAKLGVDLRSKKDVMNKMIDEILFKQAS